MHESVKYAVDRLTQTGLTDSDTLVGCSREAIGELQTKLNVQLPASYIDFLQSMGRMAGEFMVGTDYSIDRLVSFRDAAEKLFRAKGLSFAESEFVFASHQGYTFLYFNTACGEDPPVLMLTESESLPTQIAQSFSEWLRMAVEDDIEAYGPQDGTGS